MSNQPKPMSIEMTPQQTVDELDRYVIGQHKAKRAVAISLRNRYRRRQLSRELREDIRPKNLLLIGPTGVGKTEIARRIANISGIPFVKVEATKFTEVGYVGRDVDSMVRDLVEVSMSLLRSQKIEQTGPKARERAHEKLLDILCPESRKYHPLSGFEKDSGEPGNLSIHIEETDSVSAKRQQLSQQLHAGELDEKEVEIDVNEQATPMVEIFSPRPALKKWVLTCKACRACWGT